MLDPSVECCKARSGTTRSHRILEKGIKNGGVNRNRPAGPCPAQSLTVTVRQPFISENYDWRSQSAKHRYKKTNTSLRLSGKLPDDRRNASSSRCDIAQPGVFCKREARGVYCGTRPERRVLQGALRHSKIAPHFGKRHKKWRRESESNRSKRFCRPLPNLLAITPRDSYIM